MKARFSFKVFVIIALLFTSACSTDIDINGEKKDVAVVYCILSTNSQYQYIKINRAFLGEGNALEFSTIPDSTLFNYDLTVMLQETDNNGIVIRDCVIDTVNIYQSGGIFFEGFQPYYRAKINDYYSIKYDTAGKIDRTDTLWLNPASVYKLTIIDPVKGNIYESSTSSIPWFTINQPNTGTPPNGFSTINLGADNVSTMEWKSAENGKLYDVAFEFTYYEVFDSNPGDTIVKSFSWPIGSVKSSDLDGNETMTISYNNHDFYYLISTKADERDDVTRFPGLVKLSITVGGEELSTYIDINQPSGSIIQERPTYSNISNGIGLFSSKFIRTHYYQLGNSSVDTLRYGRYTKNLNFNGYYPNFP